MRHDSALRCSDNGIPNAVDDDMADSVHELVEQRSWSRIYMVVRAILQVISGM